MGAAGGGLARSHTVMVVDCRGGEPGCRCASDENESRVLYEETFGSDVLAAQRMSPPCGRAQKRTPCHDTAKPDFQERILLLSTSQKVE